MRINEFRDLLAKKYGIPYSIDQIRKIENRGIFKPLRTESGYRIYEESRECLRPVILYFFGVPEEVIIRDSREELKPYLDKIKRALRVVSQQGA